MQKKSESVDQQQLPQKTEAEQELLRMFGTEEEQKISLIDRQKMKLVTNGYKDSTIFFKMFFDKWYRRERYDAIVNKIDDYSNINEFRTVILHNYATMPLSPTRNLYILQAPKSSESAPEQAKGGRKGQEVVVPEDSADRRDDNVLIEKQYLKTYWHYFRVSMGVQAMLMTCVGYGGVSIATATFNGTVMRSFCGIGVVVHMYAMYLKRIKMANYQDQIEPLYKKQVNAYERFFMDTFDEGYE